MSQLKLAVYSVIGIVVLWFLMNGSNKGRVVPGQPSNIQSQVQSVLSSEVIPSLRLKPSSGVVAINDPNDFQLLAVGQKFSIKTNTQNNQAVVILDVISKSVSANFTLITASSGPGSTSVITLAESSTNILVKTSSNVFEYSGSAFKGVVEQVRDLNLDDDIYYEKPRSLIIKDSIPPAVRMEL
tara:strand:+ start:124 stop:675 length:552 start_codon:yes stop_codon:yes gene_type:complete